MSPKLSLFSNNFAQNTSLILLSILFLPFSTLVLLLNYAFCSLASYSLSFRQRQPRRNPTKTVLITDISTTKALTLSRLLAPHARIIAADALFLASGRFSTSVSKFHQLPQISKDGHGGGVESESAYISSLLSIIEKENVDLWIPNSPSPFAPSATPTDSILQDAAAAEIITKRTNCRVLQHSLLLTRKLTQKDSFVDAVREAGLRVPETHVVRSKEEAMKLLDEISERPRAEDSFEVRPMGEMEKPVGGKRFVLRRVRGEGRESRREQGCERGGAGKRKDETKLLPCDTREETKKAVDEAFEQRKGSTSIVKGQEEDQRYLLQEHIAGPTFCTHALVIHNRIKTFAAVHNPSNPKFPSSSSIHLTPIPPTTRLHAALLAFTETFVTAQGLDSHFTGHIGFDFIVRNEHLETMRVPGKEDEDAEMQVWPTRGVAGMRDVGVLFAGVEGVAGRYLDVLEGEENGEEQEKGEGYVVIPPIGRKIYWIGYDLVHLLILPLLSLLHGKGRIDEVISGAKAVSEHCWAWKEAVYEVWDPLPWWWMYHVYLPVQLLKETWPKRG
ncbi:hypothetical protein K402DRAFT_462539 [Aulographum hederae CBS 113979]|uniref:ATP-grasp domain-containing protein n=1 Tax=Aulographum hederae CBS 113979 TaxID=1176131 RepID=A0A6G1H352_9PEZI|nr:hypothetical protein K402DRAFT_462539 [Aulographum hederae CBS 113979]